MAPEYACEGFFSIKSDVFSFGVVVLETISGRRNSRTTVFEDGLSLLGHVCINLLLYFNDNYAQGPTLIDANLHNPTSSTFHLTTIFDFVSKSCILFI